MTRPILLSNGRLHVGINLYGMVHDLYYPHVGLENHARANNMRHRIGVWVEGNFSWLDDQTWEFAMDYAQRAQIGHTTARNRKLGVTLEFLDCVTTDEDAFLRNIHVINAAPRPREIRLFMQQVFLISNTLNGDTAQFLPQQPAILHFKGRRNFVITGRDSAGQPFNQHSIGLFGVEGHEGAFRDAEDGQLEASEVEFGKVDSVLGFTCQVAPFESTHIEYWLTCGKSQWDAIDLSEKIRKDGLAPYYERVMRHWHRWLGPAEHVMAAMEPEHRAAFRRSLFVLHSHIDHKGSVMASTDTTMLNYRRDSYSYAWPRDATYALWPLVRMGYKTEAKRYFEFCANALHPEGFLLQKFRPDGAPGSTWHPYLIAGSVIPPIQEDETAIVVILFGDYIEQTKDTEALKEYYERLVVPAANFMASYIDEKTNLPHASYDLWEEKFGTTTYTTAITFAALNTAVRLAEKMRRPRDAVRWQTVADDIQAAAAKLLFNKDRGYFYKGFVNGGDKGLQYDDVIDISSLYGAFRYGLFEPGSKVMRTSLATLEKTFGFMPDRPTPMPRYEYDKYYTVDPAGLGNPWFICTMWVAEFDMRVGNVARAKLTLDWVRSRMLGTGVLSEQVNPFTLAFASVAPLAWSQAEFLTCSLDLLALEQKPKEG